ncbi:MAG: hypothetical protein VKL98_02355 [Cyanobacteriota bacterium]|nr:hypothetical protein [Cyanobacteriota bacterium]
MNLNTLAMLTLALPLVSGAPAQLNHEATVPTATGQFQRLEQPLWSKVAVTSAGLGLIGLELWWFLLSKPRSGQARPRD